MKGVTLTWMRLGYSHAGDAVTVAGSERAALSLLRRQQRRQREELAQRDATTKEDKIEIAQHKRTEKAIRELSGGHLLKRVEITKKQFVKLGCGEQQDVAFVHYECTDKRSITVLCRALRGVDSYLSFHEHRCLRLNEDEVTRLQEQNFILRFTS